MIDNMAENNITMVRGNTLSFGMEFDGLDQDLSTAFFTIKREVDGAAIVQKTLGDGITKVETGKYRVRVAPEDTANIDVQRYYYDLQIGVNTDVYTILRGALDIVWNIS